MTLEIELYKDLLGDIKTRVRQGQQRANLSANAEMLASYWDIGKMIHQRQQMEGWGKAVIPRLAKDLKNELAEVKGFSVRNIQVMIQFYNEYPFLDLTIGAKTAQLKLHSNAQLAVAYLNEVDNQWSIINLISWTHHQILFQKIKDLPTRHWYMQQIISNGWTRDTLVDMIKSRLHERQGKAVNNFENTLPPLQSELAKQMLKDPYIFDFTTLATQYTEHELELELVKHVEKFLVELGAGFAFVGRQYHLEISDKDFYIDLLFYHLRMRCFIVIELKNGDFIPEYAGKMNFYCSAVDDILKHSTDQPTIGLILCKGKDKLFAEYALKDINKPIGISEYELLRTLPDNLKGSLPSIEEIEAELNGKTSESQLF